MNNERVNNVSKFSYKYRVCYAIIYIFYSYFKHLHLEVLMHNELADFESQFLYFKYS
jgi:hypothetical protein